MDGQMFGAGNAALGQIGNKRDSDPSHGAAPIELRELCVLCVSIMLFGLVAEGGRRCRFDQRCDWRTLAGVGVEVHQQVDQRIQLLDAGAGIQRLTIRTAICRMIR